MLLISRCWRRRRRVGRGSADRRVSGRLPKEGVCMGYRGSRRHRRQRSEDSKRRWRTGEVSEKYSISVVDGARGGTLI